MVLQCVGWKLHIAPLAKDQMFFSKTILLWTAPKSSKIQKTLSFYEFLVVSRRLTFKIWSQEVGAGSSSIIAARPNCWKQSRRRTRRASAGAAAPAKVGLKNFKSKEKYRKVMKSQQKKTCCLLYHPFIISYLPLLSPSFVKVFGFRSRP